MSEISIYTYLEPFLYGQSREAIQRVVRGVESVDRCLIGYHSFGPDGWILGSYVLSMSEHLNIMIAHRPGVMQPVVAARMAATLSAASSGRSALHIVTGGAPGDQYREGDYVGHDERYKRSSEYVQVMRKVWDATEPFSFEGDFYKFEDVRLGQKPGGDILIHMGGASPAALEFGARDADVYLLWGEPLQAVRDRVEAITASAVAVGRSRPRISLSLRLYTADTDEAAWDVAKSEPAYQKYVAKGGGVTDRSHAEDAGRNRQLTFAREGETHDDCLWMGLVAALNGLGNAAALVGTEDRVLSALQLYADAGVDTFLIAGSGGSWTPDLVKLAEKIKVEVKLR